MFFHFYLQKHYSDYNPFRNWRSSNCLTVFANARRHASIDDACGYDFEILDTAQLLVQNQEEATRCWIEVKGRAGPWDGTVHISANEEHKRDEAAGLRDVAYVIVVVEHAENWRNMNICAIIDWSADKSIFRLLADNYKAQLQKPLGRSQDRKTQVVAKQILGTVKRIIVKPNSTFGFITYQDFKQERCDIIFFESSLVDPNSWPRQRDQVSFVVQQRGRSKPQATKVRLVPRTRYGNDGRGGVPNSNGSYQSFSNRNDGNANVNRSNQNSRDWGRPSNNRIVRGRDNDRGSGRFGRRRDDSRNGPNARFAHGRTHNDQADGGPYPIHPYIPYKYTA